MLLRLRSIDFLTFKALGSELPAKLLARRRGDRVKRREFVQAEPGYLDPLPGFSTSQIGMLAGARAVVAVPMLKEGELMGVIVIYRKEVRPFTNKQIELVPALRGEADFSQQLRACPQPIPPAYG